MRTDIIAYKISKNKDFSDFYENVGRDCSREYLEKIIKSKSLEQSDVDYIFENVLRSITFEDILADGILNQRGVDSGNNYLIFDIVFKTKWDPEKDNFKEQAITAVHEFLHIFYRLAGDEADKKTGDLVEVLIEEETRSIFKERPKFAESIFNTCVKYCS